VKLKHTKVSRNPHSQIYW